MCQPKVFCLTEPAPNPSPSVTLLPGSPFAGKARAIESGEWAGWYQWDGTDPFEETSGPFYFAHDTTGLITGFRPGAKNRNGHGMIHGGALMTFADFSLFMIAATAQGEDVNGVTVTMTSEFLSPAQAGELLICRGERTGGGRSLIIARGVITADDRPVLGFSGVIRQFRKNA